MIAFVDHGVEVRMKSASFSDAAACLRQMSSEDRAEIERQIGRDPDEDLIAEYLVAGPASVAMINGDYVACWGHLSNGGVWHPWAFTTCHAAKYPFTFAKASRAVLRSMKLQARRAGITRLEIHVDAKHDRAIRWLIWLGFRLGFTRRGEFGSPMRHGWMEA